MKLINLIGNIYSRWTVLRRGKSVPKGHIYWVCKCECGNEREVSGARLKNGGSKSCGCLIPSTIGSNARTHGMRNTDEYKAWRHIKTRCLNLKSPASKNYGRRGIKVCDRWIKSFENFYNDMGLRPTKRHSIDRYPNKNGNYDPTNCRWATSKEQNRNRRDNIYFTVEGITATLAEHCETRGLKYKTVHKRIADGAGIDVALCPTRLKRNTIICGLSRG